MRKKDSFYATKKNIVKRKFSTTQRHNEIVFILADELIATIDKTV